MANKNFWNDASRGGAIIGLISIAFSLAGMLLPKVNFVAGLASFVVIIYMLFYFTRRRSMLYTEEGFSYSQSLGFIIAMGIFSGIISGAFHIVASNFLFTEYFEQEIAKSIAILKESAVYNSDMIEQISEMMHSYSFSPLPVLLSNIIGNILLYGFYGLFISIGTKREAAIFDNSYEEQDE